jgi:DNA topoisomerase-1
MSKSLVIVESPAKAKTIGKYLGRDYIVKASLGHIKDLPKKSLGVQIKKNFEPNYKIIPGKEKVVAELKEAARGVDAIYLAADHDREGEAICQHLAEELGDGDKKVYRVLFNEITEKIIREAFQHPRSVDTNKVEAQQARRILDRLVGYKISPLLWDKVRRGLSAGRVQTVALRIIVEREREIRAFVSEEYWTLTANLSAKNPPPFNAKAVKLDGEKFKVTNGPDAMALVEELQKADFIVENVTKKEKKMAASAPFITSKLQQEASRKLKLPVSKTMSLAQKLYEGVEMGDEGSIGLITYMRTDSPRVSDEAITEVREYINQKHGKKYLPSKPHTYRSRKSAQEAHEAIRPTSVFRTPESVQQYLSRDEFRLYSLIWRRFVASQMNPAIFNQTDIDIKAGRCMFKAVGSVPVFDGFLTLYQESKDESAEEEDAAGVLPEVAVGEVLKLNKLTPEQKFTQPPPRYSEAMLVKALEEKGIGRPSTYATILSVIQNREYVVKNEGKFVPTETGELVTDLLLESFSDMFDYDYTARMEEHLDKIEEGKERWTDAMKRFWARFSKMLATAEKEMRDVKREEIETNEVCDKCGSKMVIKWGRFGKFMACSAYPECRNTRELANKESNEPRTLPEGLEDRVCDKCGRPMVLKRGRYGEFLACSGYPECKTTMKIVTKGDTVQVKADVPLDENCPVCGERLVLKHGRFGEFTACSKYPECKYIKQKLVGVKCPGCGSGDVAEKKSRRGRVFYGCTNYPDCNFVLWYKPIPESCPKCGRSYLIERTTKKKGQIKYCDNKECGYEEQVSAESALPVHEVVP